MTFLEIIDSLLFRPLQYLFELIYMNVYRVIGSPGLSIIALSLVMNCLLLPLYKRADALQEEERQTEARLSAGVTQIKKAFRGDERMMILQTYYRQNNYKPTYVLRGAVSLLLEIPFFMAAYRFLSNLVFIQGVAFGPIRDLGLPDGLLTVGGVHINVLPVVMTAVNLISCVIFTKGAPLKSKLQLYGMAVFFLFFLYDSPSGLVFYWTLNNVFSLGKTVFYKLKDPRRFLRIGASLLGLGLLVGALTPFMQHRPGVRSAAAVCGVLLQLPTVWHLLPKRQEKQQSAESAADPKLFVLAAAFLALFVGGYIPMSVIVSSAEEFVNVHHYESPLWFVVSSFCLAVGSFVIWPGVFYCLAAPRTKRRYEVLACILLGIAVLDFLCFGSSDVILTSTLNYEEEPVFTLRQIVINAAAVAAIAGAAWLAMRYFRKHARRVIAMLTLAVAVIVGINAVNVSGQVSAVRKAAKESKEPPSYTVSKNGKNVVVIMLDRAMGEFVPFLFNERPELKEQFDGFTAYTNVVSFGAYTNFGTPALLGGYEYTVENINRRADESLKDKQNEALKVMPVLFSENGFEATVFQPPYANYQWIPDLSIYDDHPQIRRYNTTGAFASVEDEETADTFQNWQACNMRNFFLYGLMKASPLGLQKYIYGDGNYNKSYVLQENSVEWQTTEGSHMAKGGASDFLNSYYVLTNLPQITQVSEEPTNTFLFFANDSTHDTMLLQEPEYEPRDYVDNREYDAAHADRFTLDGTRLDMSYAFAYAHYQCNMAAMIQLGNWFDYLRQCGVYDNTRIILVSDHGRDLKINKDRILPDGTDTDFFYPILYVKDFNATGFRFSDTFMTTADVPTLATNGVIENPVNPFTGNAISSDAKQGNTYVLYSEVSDVGTNGGNQFLPGIWYRVDNRDMRDKNNWIKVAEDACLPEG